MQYYKTTASHWFLELWFHLMLVVGNNAATITGEGSDEVLQAHTEQRQQGQRHLGSGVTSIEGFFGACAANPSHGARNFSC